MNSQASKKSAQDFAWKVHDNLSDWTARVDVKASIALATEAAVLGFVITADCRGRLSLQRLPVRPGDGTLHPRVRPWSALDSVQDRNRQSRGAVATTSRAWVLQRPSFDLRRRLRGESLRTSRTAPIHPYKASGR